MEELTFPNHEKIMEELNKSKSTIFSGGLSQSFETKVRQTEIDRGNCEFLIFLHSDIFKELLQRNRMKIYLETGNIYYDN